ncbi:MAG: hypothetical protein RIQ81_1509 [Pseudomonadota bacterium]
MPHASHRIARFLVFMIAGLTGCSLDSQRRKIEGRRKGGEQPASVALPTSGASFSFTGKTVLSRSMVEEVLRKEGDFINDRADSEDNTGPNASNAPEKPDDQESNCDKIGQQITIEGAGDTYKARGSIGLSADNTCTEDPLMKSGARISGHFAILMEGRCGGGDFSGLSSPLEPMNSVFSERLSSCGKSTSVVESRVSHASLFEVDISEALKKLNGQGAPAASLQAKFHEESRRFFGSPDGGKCRRKIGPEKKAVVDGACVDFNEKITLLPPRSEAGANLGLSTSSSFGIPRRMLTPSLHSILSMAGGGAQLSLAGDEMLKVLILIDRSKLIVERLPSGELGRYRSGKADVQVNNWKGVIDFDDLNDRNQPAYSLTRIDQPGEKISGRIETANDPRVVPPIPEPTPPSELLCQDAVASAYPASAAQSSGFTPDVGFTLGSLGYACKDVATAQANCRHVANASIVQAAQPKGFVAASRKSSGAWYFEVLVTRSCNSTAGAFKFGADLNLPLASTFEAGIDLGASLLPQGSTAKRLKLSGDELLPPLKAGDVIRVFVQVDNPANPVSGGKLYLGINNSWADSAGLMYGASLDVAKVTAFLPAAFGDTTYQYGPSISLGSGWQAMANFGQLAFKYAKPSVTGLEIKDGWGHIYMP